MTEDSYPEDQPTPESRVDPSTDPDEHEGDDEDEFAFGRVGYGKYGRYSPAVLGLLIVLVVAVIGWRQWQPDDQAPSTGSLIEQQAPDFTLELFNGEMVTLADLEGEAVVLNFWGSWCAPCKTEMPDLQQAQTQFLADGIPATVIGVGIKNDYGEAAQDLVNELGITYPAGRDTAGENATRGPIEAAYGVFSYPTTVFIRPDGTVSAVRLGPVSKDDVIGYVDAALKE